ncbi:MAG TPA: hypothetical protein VMR02_06425 [Terracidiphilus sp.]|nr:hypothetical protein [Terracidiphilus sp.]
MGTIKYGRVAIPKKAKNLCGTCKTRHTLPASILFSNSYSNFWVDCSAAFSLISAENQVPLSRFDLARITASRTEPNRTSLQAMSTIHWQRLHREIGTAASKNPLATFIQGVAATALYHPAQQISHGLYPIGQRV